VSWLWVPHNTLQWVASVSVQTVVGFLVAGVLLTPGVGQLRRFYRRQTDPTSPGGAGSRIVAGREVHDILADAAKNGGQP
jgi:hypothetical protein